MHHALPRASADFIVSHPEILSIAHREPASVCSVANPSIRPTPPPYFVEGVSALASFTAWRESSSQFHQWVGAFWHPFSPSQRVPIQNSVGGVRPSCRAAPAADVATATAQRACIVGTSVGVIGPEPKVASRPLP